MSSRRFGTDGIRGPAGRGPLAPAELLALGHAVAARLRHRRGVRADPPRVLIGRDTRLSGPLTAGALTAGLQAGGAAVDDGGILPTPAVALLVARGHHDLGVAISASHNATPDNGLKFLGPDGEKVDDAFERAVERGLPAGRRAAKVTEPSAPPAAGRLVPGAADDYVDAVVREFRGLSLRRLKVVVDPAHGAAHATAAAILGRLGAAVETVHGTPDGARINARCGALHPAACGRAVRRRGADLGLALDGDADRLVLLDDTGRARDGDDLLAALAPHLKARRRLRGGAVVGTVMSNGGLDAHLRQHGIELVRTPVGDRHVASALRERGLVLGAEPSGHVLLRRSRGPWTSDGVVAALWVLRAMAESGRSLAELLAGFERAPRAEAAVPVSRKPALARIAGFAAARRRAEELVGPDGRLLIRYSGTEPKLRLLAESPSPAAAQRALALLREAVVAAIGSGGARSK